MYSCTYCIRALEGDSVCNFKRVTLKKTEKKKEEKCNKIAAKLTSQFFVSMSVEHREREEISRY